MANSTHRIRVIDGLDYAELLVRLSGVTYLRVLGGPDPDKRWFEQPSGEPVEDTVLTAVLNSIAGVREVKVP